MPTVTFTRTGFVVEAPDGGAITELCDANFRAGVPFACRHANCGSCRVIVEEGEEFCEPAESAELRLLRVFGEPPGLRLACQLKLRAGTGSVKLRVVR